MEPDLLFLVYFVKGLDNLIERVDFLDIQAFVDLVHLAALVTLSIHVGDVYFLSYNGREVLEQEVLSESSLFTQS